MSKRSSSGKNHRPSVEEYQNMTSPVHNMSAGSKLLLLLVYIILVTSFHNYRAVELFVMVLFPVIAYQFAYIPVSAGLMKFKLLLPFICIIGIFNPIFDKNIIMYIGRVPVTGGWLSMLSLVEKAIFCLMGTLLFVFTTKIDDICRALLRLHFPRKMLSILAITYRYVFVLIDEINEMKTYYSLRAPATKGVNFKHAGSFLGQLLLRTMDRGQEIYECMELRGYKGDIYFNEDKFFTKSSLFIAILGIGLMIMTKAFVVGL